MAEERWTTIQPGIPANLTAAANLIDSIIEFLIAVANIALATLEIAKSVLSALLDPIRAIIEQVIAEIEAFLNDLRQIGIYVTWDDATYPFTDFTGGYAAYRSRMVGKLTNRADPTRPAFTERSGVCGIFIYASANPTSIYAVLDLINLLLRMFGVRRRTRGFATPVGLGVTYGGPDITAFGNLSKILAGNAGTTPDTAKVRWTLAAPPTVVGPMPFIPAPPKFLVEVSVFENGLGIAYNLPTPNANQGRQTFGVLTDYEGTPFRVYGGQTLGVEDSLSSTASGTELTIPGVDANNKPKPNNVTVYAFRDASDAYPIPLSTITGQQSDGKYLFQRTFVYDVRSFMGINLLSPGQPFLFRLNAADMPYNATISAGSNGRVNITPDDAPAREVYVRVRSVADGYTYNADKSLSTPLYTINEATFNSTGTVTPAYLTFPGASGVGYGFGSASDPIKVTFPEVGTAEYLDTVTVAVLLLLLSRSDLRPQVESQTDINYILGLSTELNIQKAIEGKISYERLAAIDVGLCPTGLETQARTIAPMFGATTAGALPGLKELFGREDTDQLSFKTNMLNRSRQLAEYFLNKAGPPTASMLELVESLSQVSGTVMDENGSKTSVAATPLRQLTWGQIFPEVADKPIGGITILDYFKDRSVSDTGGVAPNPLSIPGNTAQQLRGLYAGSYTIVQTDTGNDITVNTVSNRYSLLLRRSPGFFLRGQPVTLADGGTAIFANMDQGNADMSPVIYATATPPLWRQSRRIGGAATVVFIRNGVVRFPALANAIDLVLGYAAGAATTPVPVGAWTAIRLFPQGLPPIEEFLQKINDFMRAVLDGLQGIIDAILAYINFIEARILEIEALLRRIDALIDLALSFDIGVAASGLLITSNGTDGLVRDFLNASNTPDSGQDDISIGFALVSGGIPAFLFDILLAFFPEA